MGNFAKQAFSQIKADPNEPESSPCLPRARKRSRAFSFQLSVCLVLSAVFILFYFILFILFYFMSIPAKANRTNQRSNERCAEGRVCIAHTLCIYMIYMFAVSLANSRFYDYPSLCCSRSLR